MLLPSIILVIGGIWLGNPAWLTGDTVSWLLLLTAVITISYTLYALNMPLIRLLEGYMLAETPIAHALRAFQRWKYQRHLKQIEEYKRKLVEIRQFKEKLQWERNLTDERLLQLEAWKKAWQDRINHERERLEERYPRPARLLPTALGNAIAVFEAYPYERYGMDMGVLWTRFVPTLMKKDFSELIKNEKMLLDFFTNLIMVFLALWAEAMIMFAATGRHEAMILFVLLPVLTVVAYRGACVAAVNWGSTVKTSFDLYRFELHKDLNLRRPNIFSLKGEREMWEAISRFMAYGDDKEKHEYDGFDYERAFYSNHS
jgi:hypothetical protein